MQYLRGWRALRNDPEWMAKVGWGSLLLLSGMCIPVIGSLVLIGWNTLMLRRAVSGQDAPLPRLEFDTDYLMKLMPIGFKAFLAQLLWSIPLVGVVFVGYGCIVMGILGLVGGVGVGAEMGGDAGAGVGMILGMVLMLLAYGMLFALIFVVSMVMQIAVMRVELTDDLNAAMRVGEVLKMTKMLAKELFLGTIVLQLIVGIPTVLIAIFTLYLGLFPCIVVVQIIVTYFRAELYRVYLEKGGEPLQIGPLAVEGGDAPTVGPHQQAYTAPAQF